MRLVLKIDRKIEEVISTIQLAKENPCTVRQIRYWASRGYVSAVIGKNGKDISFNDVEAHVIVLMAHLTEIGFEPRNAVEIVREHMESGRPSTRINFESTAGSGAFVLVDTIGEL